MRPVPVVVSDVLAEHNVEMAFAGDQHPVGAAAVIVT
jgi:hypothetical protein